MQGIEKKSIFDYKLIENGSKNNLSSEIFQNAVISSSPIVNEITGEDLLRSEITDIPTLVHPFLQQTGLACIAGSSDTGKSTILRQLAISIVAGDEEFLDFKINAKHRSVIYVSTEDLQRETTCLLRRQTKRLQPEQLKGLRFIFDTNNLFTELDNRLQALPADLVIIDCFADIYDGDLKDTQGIRSSLHNYQSLAQKHECLIVFLHHTSKRTEHAEPSKNNLLSGQGFEAKMRLVVELKSDAQNPLHRHFCIVKGNYLPASYKRESYVLQFDEENFTFSNTSGRVSFELLAKQPEDHDSKEKYLQAKELKAQGQSYEKIATTIGFSSKGSVTKLLERGKRNGWDETVSTGVSLGNGGNDEETPL